MFEPEQKTKTELSVTVPVHRKKLCLLPKVKAVRSECYHFLPRYVRNVKTKLTDDLGGARLSGREREGER